MYVYYEAYNSVYKIKNTLAKLNNCKMLSFDTETRSIFDKKERQKSKLIIQNNEYNSNYEYKKNCLISNSSGLSFPSVVKTTHFVFSKSPTVSHILICDNHVKENMVWNFILKYKGKLIIHNALFDLKILYQRTGQLPKNYVDTSLLAKCLTNHVNVWKCKVGLKDLMGKHYDPIWSLMDNYEPEDYKDKNFLNYVAIDGAATFYLYELIKDEMAKNEKNNL